MRQLPRVLPCHPCPHQSSCCAWGTDLTAAEADALESRYGRDKIERYGSGVIRTVIRDNACIFLVNNACSIHDDPHYPSVCRHFPWRDSDHPERPYGGDLSICPELA